MNTRTPVLIALATLGFTVQADAVTPRHVRPTHVESVVEATADSVVLPSSPDGILVVNCSGCTPRSFRATASTSYSLDAQASTLKDLRKALAAQPRTNLNLSIDPKTRELLTVDAVSQAGVASTAQNVTPGRAKTQVKPANKPGNPKISR